MKRKRQDWAPVIPGIRNLPDGMDPDDFEWGPLGPRFLSRAEVNALWADWNRRKVKIENDWRQDAAKRLAVATAEIEKDKRQALVLAEWERRDQFFKDDAQQTAAYVAKLMKFEDDLWRKQATARLKKATVKIKASDARIAKRTVNETLARLGKPVRRKTTYPGTP